MKRMAALRAHGGATSAQQAALGFEQCHEFLRERQHAQAASAKCSPVAQAGGAFHRQHGVTLLARMARGGLRIERVDREIDYVRMAAHRLYLESHG